MRQIFALHLSIVMLLLELKWNMFQVVTNNKTPSSSPGLSHYETGGVDKFVPDRKKISY